jgi:putative peptidoglycan lipid II flippase
MAALGAPLVSLLFVGGRFSAADASECALYFAVFSISMFLWSAQAIYARAFYAAGNTILPMAAGTIVTLVSLPIYAALYNALGAMGLAIASDIGIAIQTLALAVMLHQRRMISLASLDYRELGRCLLASVAAGALVWTVFIWLAGRAAEWAGPGFPLHSRWFEFLVLLAGTALWLIIVKTVLERTGSALPRVTMKRLGMG